MGGAPVERLFALTDDVPDRLAQTQRAAMAWGKAETPNARITSELFVITQHGLMYAAGFNESRRALYYLATPPALFDPFVDQVDTAGLREGAIVVVDAGSAAISHPRIRWTPRCARYSMRTWRCGWICPRSYFLRRGGDLQPYRTQTATVW